MAIQRITGRIIEDGAIEIADIADGAITDDKIAGVATSKLTGTISTAQIADSSVTATKLDTTYLTPTGDGSGLSGIASFDAGTLMLFQQTAAPTGWTKQTTHNDKSLRVVSGTASSGGSVAFTSAFTSQTPTGSVAITSVTGSAGATTLSTPQIPSHTHPVPARFNQGLSNYAGPFAGGDSGLQNSGATGGGGSHNHPFSFSSGSGTFSGNAINLAVQYVDLIIASKD